ncbi:MAG TPA: YggT family protein [Candidatus Limnocylindrales bacterium]|nr:YggT family protein [Candidatus Limnocylindrales bacterium]
MGFVTVFLGTLSFLLWVLVFGRVMLSWFDPTGRSSLARFLFSITEPILAPIRGLLPQSGTFDFSGLLVLVVLGFIWRALL